MSFILFPNFYLAAAWDAVGFFFYMAWTNFKMDLILARLRFWTVLKNKFEEF